MLKGKAKQNIDTLLRKQISASRIFDDQLTIEIFRLYADAIKEITKIAGENIKKGTATPKNLTDLMMALGVYESYMCDEFGIDETDNFKRVSLPHLKSEQAQFKYFFENVYRKNPKYVSIWDRSPCNLV